MLEFYPPGEEDSFNPSRPAVTVYDDASSPDDLAGELVSHYLGRGANKRMSTAYGGFERSINDEQNNRLGEMYGYAMAHEGEQRPYADWREMTGVPAYFRGRAFHQWADEDGAFTPEQIKRLDQLRLLLMGRTKR